MFNMADLNVKKMKMSNKNNEEAKESDYDQIIETPVFKKLDPYC